MLLLPSRPQEHLLALASIAEVIRDEYLNHERRNERLELLARMVETQMGWASPEYLTWLYALHALVFALYASPSGIPHSLALTHTEVKVGLRLFAETCQHAVQAIDKAEAEARGS